MRPIYYQQMTPQGYAEIEAEIEGLKKQRPALLARLKAAAALGDRSENAEYTSSKRDLRHLESRLRYLDKQLKYAKVITPTDSGQVDLGSLVKLEFLDDHWQEEYLLVGRHEADLAAHKLAFDSPLGQAIRHQAAGAVVTVTAPDGSYQVKVLSVRLANDE